MTKRVLYTKVPLPPFFITLVQTQATESVTFSILLLIFVHGEYHSLKEKNANIDFFFITISHLRERLLFSTQSFQYHYNLKNYCK